MSMGGLGMKINAGGAFVTLGVQDHLSKGLSAAEKKLKDFGQRAASLGSKLAGASLAVVGPGVMAAKTFADFEHSMARVRGLTGATKDEFSALWQQAKKLGADTQFTARDAAEGMAFYAQAGFKVKEIQDAMLPTLDLAAAGQMGVAESADILAKIMRSMGVEAADVGYNVDVLTKAMATANTDLRQLGDAFKYAGPVAHMAGMSFEETTAFIQMMSDAGMQADLAGTTLRGALLAVTSPSAAAAEQLKAMNVDIADANGNMLSMATIVAQLELAMAGMGSAERMEKLGVIFDNRQAAGFARALAEGGQQLLNMTEALRDSDGYARKFASIQMNTLAGQWELMTSAVETLMITLGEIVNQPLRSFLRGLTDIVGWMLRFVEANQWIVILLGAIGITTALAALYFLTLALASMVAQAGIQLFGFVMRGATIAVQAATVALRVLGVTLSLLASPWGIVAAAVLTVIGAVIYLSGVMESQGTGIANTFTWLYETLTSVLGAMYNAIIAGRLDLAFNILMTGVAYVLTTTLGGIVGIFGTHIDAIAMIIGGVYKFFGRLLAWFNEIRVSITNWITGVIGWIMGIDTSLEQQAGADAAKKWAQEWKDMDTTGLTNNIANSLDPNTHRQKLDELMAEAAKAREEAFADPEVLQGPARPGAPTGAIDGVPMDEATKFATVGNFSTTLLNRQLPGAKSKEDKLVANSAQTVKELIKIGNTLAGAPGFAFAP